MNLTAWLTRLRDKLLAPQPQLPQVHIRPATEADLDLIVALVQQEARAGHFNPLLAEENAMLGFSAQLYSLVFEGIYPRPTSGDVGTMRLSLNEQQQLVLQGSFDYCPGKVEVIEADQQFAVFHILYAEPPKSRQKSVEYYFLAILPEYRSRGYAHMLVDHAFRTTPNDYTITARCYPKSEVMYQYFLRRGFILKSTTHYGTRIIYLPPRSS